MQEWQDKIQAAIRTTRDDDAIKAVMARLPGFKGVRQQVFDLHRFAKDDWGRIRRKAKSWEPPARPGYVRFRSDETIPAAQVMQRLLMEKAPFGKESAISEPEPSEGETMAVVNVGREPGLSIPRGRDACRVLLIREAEQIRTFIAERWSYESIRLWLLDRYGATFDIPLPAFRERVRRALQVKAGSVLKSKAEAIQAVRVIDQVKKKESEPVKEPRLT